MTEVTDKWRAHFIAKMQRSLTERHGVAEPWRIAAIMRAIDDGNSRDIELAIQFYGFIDAEMDGDFPFEIHLWQGWQFHDWTPHNID